MSRSFPGDVSSTTPRDFPQAPLETLSSELRTYRAVLELLIDDPDEFVDEVVDEVLAMPADRRFESSVTVLEEHAREAFGSVEAFWSQFPAGDPEKALDLLETLSKKLRDETLEGVFQYRDPETHLVLVAAYQLLLDAVGRIDATEDDEERRRLVSTCVALLARIYDASANRTDEDGVGTELRTIADDVGWAISELYDRHDPTEVDPETALEGIRAFGAVVAYGNLDISVSRGAELAKVSTTEFETTLAEGDVRPRYGPESVEELRRDGMDE